MMRLAIFGASGRTGQHVLRLALAEGYEVSILARSPEKITIQDDRLAVVKGDLKDASCVEKVVDGAGAVLSVLGPASNKPIYEVSQGTATIIQAMKNFGVKRLIISAGAGVGDPHDAPKLFDKGIGVLLKATAKYVYDDMVRTVERVRASDLDWTVVRVPMLTDNPARGQVRVGMVGKGTGPRLSREDLAMFMLEQVKDEQYLHQSPVISN